MNQQSLERGVGIGAMLLVFVAAWATAQTPVREITQIAGEVYRFRNNNHYSVFAVTPQGIIATDPINAEAAQWLKAELQKRFAKPVKYLIYSHDHADHISGGEVFADTAVVVGEQGDAGGNCKTPVEWPVLCICHSNPEKPPYACQTAARHV